MYVVSHYLTNADFTLMQQHITYILFF